MTGTPDELVELIDRATAARCATAEQHQAFGEIVRRFQDMAFACAYAVLGDFHQAEDAAQNAFVVAWRNLSQLRKPEAFPGWFKRIVLTQCNRLTRGNHLHMVSLDALIDLPANGLDPYEEYEQKERQIHVYAAVRALPENERIATTLFYISDYSQNEIADFLEVPVTTVKKRLFSARRKLRESSLKERMLEMVSDTLQEKRPSRNEEFAGTVALFNAALESFVNKVRQDRYVIAALLYGSMAHDVVWRKSDIDIILIGREERPARDLFLVENGINIHACLVSRSKWKQSIEGALQGSFGHSSFALSTLLYTNDPTIREYYQNVQTMGSFDRDMRLLRASCNALNTLAKAEKWFYTRKDLSLSFLWIMYTVEHLATIEVVLHGVITSREVIPQALKLNPTFFNKIYYDLIHQKKDETIIQNALDLINNYLAEKVNLLFGVVLAHLAEAGGIRTTSELDEYFAKQAQIVTLCTIYEWLADNGIIQKVPSPLRLTHKSQVTVDEAAYYYDPRQ
jgi:RNA polymerase sigma factor (sigma-70 family)